MMTMMIIVVVILAYWSTVESVSIALTGDDDKTNEGWLLCIWVGVNNGKGKEDLADGWEYNVESYRTSWQ